MLTTDVVCVLQGVAFFSFTWDFGEAMCRLVNYVQNYSMICSVLTLTVISLERYATVCLCVCVFSGKFMASLQRLETALLGEQLLFFH